MAERLKYEEAVEIINENIDECIKYWENESVIKKELKESIIDALEELKGAKNIYKIGDRAISEYDRINSNKILMSGTNNDMKERSLGVFWGQIYKLRVLIKSLDVSTRDIVSNSFKEIITIGKIGEGWRKVISRDNKYKDTPDMAFNHITNGGDGNSFIFASSLAKLLHEQGVKSDIVVATNTSKNRYAVMYTEKNDDDRDVKYIADPYAEIKDFTKKNINSKVERELAYNGKVKHIHESADNVIDNSRLSMEQFLGKNDYVWMMGNPYQEDNKVVGNLFSNINVLAENSDKNNPTPENGEHEESNPNNEDR